LSGLPGQKAKPFADSGPNPTLILVSASDFTVPAKPPLDDRICRVVGPNSRLDHVNVTRPGVYSLWHVDGRARDLGGLCPYDSDMMLETSVPECLDSMGVLLGRCLAMVQHCRVAVERQADLQNKITKLEEQIQDLRVEREGLFYQIRHIPGVWQVSS